MKSLTTSMTLNAGWLEDAGSLLLGEEWNRLSSGVPFRMTQWLEPWHEHLAPIERLSAITVTAPDGMLVGALPLYQTSHHVNQKTWCTLADGILCTDFVSLHVDRNFGEPVHVAERIADLLLDRHDHQTSGWRRLYFDGVTASDTPMMHLLECLGHQQASVAKTSRMHTWRVDTDRPHDAYLEEFGRQSRRKQRKQLCQLDDDPALELETAVGVDHSLELMDELINLHQRRWNSVGLPGSFPSRQMRQFIRDVVKGFAELDSLWLTGLKRNGCLCAAALSLVGEDNVAYCYCTATDVSLNGLQPGTSLTTSMIRQACESRRIQAIDFLRGDEPYKKRYHAEPNRVLQVRVGSPHVASRLSFAAWQAGFDAKQWLRKGLGRDATVMLP